MRRCRLLAAALPLCCSRSGMVASTSSALQSHTPQRLLTTATGRLSAAVYPSADPAGVCRGAWGSGLMPSPRAQFPQAHSLLAGLWRAPQQQQSRGLQMQPRNFKFRKALRSCGFNDTVVPNTRQLAWGQFGIRAVEPMRLQAKTIEGLRRVLRRKLKKTTKIWIRLNPDVPVTKKPAETRMGKGKGAVAFYAAPIRPGQIMFEMDRCSKTAALQALQAIQYKLPIRLGLVEWS